MSETCMFDIMDLSDESLKKALPKVSVKILMRLVTAYPRAIGRKILDTLAQTMSPNTVEFLKDQMSAATLPSIEQIREAELELIKIIHDEHLLPETAGYLN